MILDHYAPGVHEGDLLDGLGEIFARCAGWAGPGWAGGIAVAVGRSGHRTQANK